MEYTKEQFENMSQEEMEHTAKVLLNTLKIHMGTPEQFKDILHKDLNKITRKEFLQAIKEKYIYYTIGENGEDIPHKTTDSISGATGWILTSERTRVFFIVLANIISPNDRDALREYLVNEIAKKAREISRNRGTKGKAAAANLDGSTLPMFTSRLNTLFPSVTKSDYMETADGKLKAKHYTAPDLYLQAEPYNGTITTLDINAGMVYMMLQAKLAKQINSSGVTEEEQRTVYLSLEEYKSLRGLNSEAGARNALKHAALALACASVVYTVSIGENGEDFQVKHFFITDDTEYKGGVIKIPFTSKAIELIKQGYITEMPKELFKINLQKYPSAFYIAKKLVWHYGYNSKKNGKSANPHIISVEALLNECRTIPKYENINRNIYDRIISPFKSSLEAIEATPGNPDGFIKYSFTHAKGEPLTPGERDDLENGRIKYDDFIKLYVHFEIIDSERAKEIEI